MAHLDPPLLTAFKEDPRYFFGAFLFAVIGIGLLLAAFSKRQRPASIGLGFVAAALGALAMACGVVDSTSRRHGTDVVLMAEGLSNEDRARIRTSSDSDARMSLYFGLAVGSLPLLGGTALAVRGLTRRRRFHLASAGASMRR